MSENILRKKISKAAERRTRDSLRTSLTPELERAISKSFLELFEQEVAAHFVQKTLNTPDDILEGLQSTLFNIMSMNAGTGLICVDRQFVNTIVRGLIGASLDPEQDLVERDITPTDVALCNHFLSLSLGEIFTRMTEGKNDISFLNHETEKAPLEFILNGPRYAFLRMSIENDQGNQFGQVEFVLPIPCLEAFANPEDQHETTDERIRWQQMFEKIAQNTALEFTSVITRTNIPLSELMNMTPGNIVELGNGSIQDLNLEARTANGLEGFYNGQLGALNAQKAFKVNDVLMDET